MLFEDRRSCSPAEITKAATSLGLRQSFTILFALSSNLPSSPCCIIAHLSGYITTQACSTSLIAFILPLAACLTMASLIASNGQLPPIDNAPRKPKRAQVNVACNECRRRKVKVCSFTHTNLSLSALQVSLSRTTAARRLFS